MWHQSIALIAMRHVADVSTRLAGSLDMTVGFTEFLLNENERVYGITCGN